VLVVLAAANAGVLGAEEAEWKAGLASIRITPEEPVRMSGYASRTQPSRGVASDLYAKALVLEDKSGQRGVIMTTDLIGLRATLAESTCQMIRDKTGLARSQILINSSHTHTGPTLELDASELEFPPEQAEATVRYTTGLREKLVQLVADALGRLEPARLSWGVGVVSFPMNRREFTDRGVILGFNPRGHVDRSVPVLRVDSPDGKPRAVLFGAACHNTTLTGEHLDISGDFAGYAQAEMERQQPGVQAMFMQGCAGDANPFPRGEEAIARQHGLDLAREVSRVLETRLQPVRGPLRVQLQPVDLPLQSHFTKAEIERMREGGGGWRPFVADRMLKALERDGKLPDTYRTPIALWRFGDDLTLVGLSGEVVVDYVTRLEDALGPQRLWIAAYCNDVYGYLPSARVLEQGGYETRGLYAGGVGLFPPDVEAVVVNHVKQMAAEETWEPLFNGQDLTGWVNVNCAPGTFTVRDGMIVSTGVPTGVLRTDRQYENFILELEWKHLQPMGNAGLFVFSDAITAPGVPFTRSIEVQVLDGRTNENYTSHGDVFAIHGASMKPDRPHPQGWMRCLPSEHRCHPAGQWNHYRVVCRDGVLKLAVNGKEVSGASECRPRKGYICLEAEGSECHFRNIRIAELPSSEPGADEIAELDAGFRSLYTGVDLSGWKQEAGHAGHWQPRDWILDYDGQSAAEPRQAKNLWSEQEYGDFVLICDWRFTGQPKKMLRPVILPSGEYALDDNGQQKQVEVDDAGDSGIYLRGSGKSQVNIWCWPVGSGEVYGYRNHPETPAEVRAALTPKVKADNPLGRWNRFVITMRGDRLTVVLNGQTVIENAQLPGVPKRGPIALQHHGDPIQFANIYVKELN